MYPPFSRRLVFMEILTVMAFAPAHSACGLVLRTILLANTQLAQMAPAMGHSWTWAPALLFPLLRPDFSPSGRGCRRDLRSRRRAHLAPLPFRCGSPGLGRGELCTYDPAQFLFEAFNLFPDCNGLFKLLDRQIGKSIRWHGNPLRESLERSQGSSTDSSLTRAYFHAKLFRSGAVGRRAGEVTPISASRACLGTSSVWFGVIWVTISF